MSISPHSPHKVLLYISKLLGYPQDGSLHTLAPVVWVVTVNISLIQMANVFSEIGQSALIAHGPTSSEISLRRPRSVVSKREG